MIEREWVLYINAHAFQSTISRNMIEYFEKEFI